MNSRSQSFKIVVLAAGYSVRLGRPKALTRIHGMSLLQRTLKLAAHISRDELLIIVPPRSSRYRIEARGMRVRFAENRGRATGLASSVRLGAAAAQFSPALLFLPVDLAHLNVRDLRRLVASWRQSPGHVAAAAFGERSGIPLILPRRYYPDIAALRGDVGLRSLLDRKPHWPLRRIAMPSAHWDIDTTEELARARRRWSANG